MTAPLQIPDRPIAQAVSFPHSPCVLATILSYESLASQVVTFRLKFVEIFKNFIGRLVSIAEMIAHHFVDNRD